MPAHKGQVSNPTGVGGFGENPQNRSDGGWKKEDSISYQYNMIMRLSPEELDKFKSATVAQEIALARVKAARSDKLGLPDTREITDRTEGKAPQAIDITTGGEKLNVAMVEFINADSKNVDKNTD